LWLYFKAEQIEGKEKVNELLDLKAIPMDRGNPPLVEEEDLSGPIILSG